MHGDERTWRRVELEQWHLIRLGP